MLRRIFALTGLVSLVVVSMLFSTRAASIPDIPQLTVTAESMSCAHCVTERNACNTACNGNSDCLAQCQAEYECCLIICHNGTCRQKQDGGNVIRDKSKAGIAGASVMKKTR
ncbi:MAG TPA: hypothetical protein VEV42_05175 [Pyrinomonadaceae bacterium]|jgi:hypothetical protein|nr:hypothetical protein [Pyrinomonadaceae bacterium]